MALVKPLSVAVDDLGHFPKLSINKLKRAATVANR